MIPGWSVGCRCKEKKIKCHFSASTEQRYVAAAHCFFVQSMLMLCQHMYTLYQGRVRYGSNRVPFPETLTE